jgi:hypothetical protein
MVARRSCKASMSELPSQRCTFLLGTATRISLLLPLFLSRLFITSIPNMLPYHHEKAKKQRWNQYQSHNAMLDAYFNIVNNTKANRNAIWYRQYSAMGGINHEHEGINRPITESGRVGSNVDTAFSSTNTISPNTKTDIQSENIQSDIIQSKNIQSNNNKADNIQANNIQFNVVQSKYTQSDIDLSLVYLHLAGGVDQISSPSLAATINELASSDSLKLSPSPLLLINRQNSILPSNYMKQHQLPPPPQPYFLLGQQPLSYASTLRQGQAPTPLDPQLLVASQTT